MQTEVMKSTTEEKQLLMITTFMFEKKFRKLEKIRLNPAHLVQ